jgi:hypothetical protein
MTPEETIISREAQHGSFKNVSDTAQNLKTVIRDSAHWDDLMNIQQEALDLIITKIARILSGNADFQDHWHDIAGYAILVEQFLKEK